VAEDGSFEAAVDLLGPAGTGPLWGMASAELNATLLAWPPGHALVEDAALDLDVLLIVLQGSGTAKVDGREHALAAGSALLIERGRTRELHAGPDGLRYLSVHRRRGPLQLAGIPERP
jgi:mannose-6-phosphate isomerase-like protein (cupin superfamily)